MSQPFKQPKRQYCPQCNWQSEIIQQGDCLIGIVKQCPKCRQIIPLALKDANSSSLAKLFSYLTGSR